jgi:hypothetical protein
MVHDITSFLFFRVHGVDVASQEVQKVHDITSFLLSTQSAPRPSAKGAPRPSAAAKRSVIIYISQSQETLRNIRKSHTASRRPKAGEHPWPKAWVRTWQLGYIMNLPYFLGGHHHLLARRRNDVTS